MFERYSEAARQSLFWARYALTWMGGASLEPEHLLAGLERARGGVAAEALHAAGLDGRAIRARVTGPGEPLLPTSIEVRFSGSCTRVLTAAQIEADQMSTTEITTGHLLLGLLRDDTTQAFRILHEAGVRLNDLRATVETAATVGPERGHADPDESLGFGLEPE